jgi:hypothetical protein
MVERGEKTAMNQGVQVIDAVSYVQDVSMTLHPC